jgi:pimeloyl-ACP methyl ester carboxylesterase
LKVILLPGLDGTGKLFESMLSSLVGQFDFEVISYDSLDGRTYLEQANELAVKFDKQKVIIVAESYSGRVAYELYRLMGGRVVSIVFIASFVTKPSFLARFVNHVPLFALKSNFVSKSLLYLIGFSLQGGYGLTAHVFKSTVLANQEKLKSRLDNIAHLDEVSDMIRCKVTYIRPTKDLLVGEKAFQFLKSICSDLSVIEIGGGHFIAQAKPDKCAACINDAIAVYGRD